MDKVRKNIVVTGGNNGIGYQTVAAMYQDNHNVIFGSRNSKRNQQALEKIKQHPSQGSIHTFQLDLSKKDSVMNFAEKIKAEFKDHIDILVNNAGLIMGDQQKTCDQLGVEQTLAINHFGHFYLTYLLFDLICKSKEGKIINLSSTAHYQAPKNFLDDLACSNKKYSKFDQYAISKLFNVVYTVGLNQLLKQKKITHVKTASVHPGVVDTGFGDVALQQSGCLRCLKACFACCMKKPNQGATTSIYLCRLPFEIMASGEYYDSDTAIKQMDKRGRDLNNAKQLWKISEQKYGIKF